MKTTVHYPSKGFFVNSRDIFPNCFYYCHAIKSCGSCELAHMTRALDWQSKGGGSIPVFSTSYLYMVSLLQMNPATPVVVLTVSFSVYPICSVIGFDLGGHWVKTYI